MEQVGLSIYLRHVSGEVTKEMFIGYYPGTTLQPSKIGTVIVHYYFFSLARPRDKQFVFAIQAKLGLIPQMDVGLYNYESNHYVVCRFTFTPIQSSLAITLSPGGIFWDRGISEARYRFCRQVFFFFLILYIFFDCKLL